MTSFSMMFFQTKSCNTIKEMDSYIASVKHTTETQPMAFGCDIRITKSLQERLVKKYNLDPIDKRDFLHRSENNTQFERGGMNIDLSLRNPLRFQGQKPKKRLIRQAYISMIIHRIK